MLPLNSLLVLYSYHHHNTEKIANVVAKVLDAQIKTPQQIESHELQGYDLIGFGSGTYDGKHHRSLLDLADNLPPVDNKKAFIFSTNGAPARVMDPEYAGKNHLPLREKLLSKGYVIVDEFSCTGLNTNSFLRFFGGINKGRPNAEDLRRAEEFAQNLKRTMQ
jgi:flavodoxin